MAEERAHGERGAPPTTVAARPAGTQRHDLTALEALTDQWARSGTAQTVQEANARELFERWEAALDDAILPSAEARAPQAFWAFQDVVTFLKHREAGGWALQVVAVQTGRQDDVLVPGDPAAGTGDLRVISRRLEPGEQGVSRRTIRLYVPHPVLAGASRAGLPDALVFEVAHELLQQAPEMAFRQSPGLPRAPGEPANHWAVAVYETLALEPVLVYGVALSPRQAADLRRGSARPASALERRTPRRGRE
jgi:hypothetical protein